MLILKTVNADMTSYNGFRWPESGPVVAPDWNPARECGGGLHGLPWGEGEGRLLDRSEKARWIVFEASETDVVCFGGKCKAPRGVVLHVGDQKSATDYILANGGAGHAVACASVSVGDYGTATAGCLGTATAGDYGTATVGDDGTATAGDYGDATAGDDGTATAGYRGTATVGKWGTAVAGDGGTAIAGDYGTATAGDGGTATAGCRGTATAGDYGTATVGKWGTAVAGDYGTAIAGDYGTATAGDDGTATVGCCGAATAGYRGIISIKWYDGRHYHLEVGHVGENGIEPNMPYVCDQSGKLVRA